MDTIERTNKWATLHNSEQSPASQDETHPTPEELRWRAATSNPERIRKNLKIQYIILCICILLLLAWGILYLCGVKGISWLDPICIAGPLFSAILGISNAKRILSGRKPWGEN